MSQLRVRRSFRDIEKEHFSSRVAGNLDPTELETLVRAWAGIQALSPTDFNSFFTIAGYHGEPFRGPGSTDPQWWGGYCAHGNILFPVWHRAYLLRLEDALRSIKGCENATLPYWDETDDATVASGVPDTFGLRTFTLADGSVIPNPLFSYTFQNNIVDSLPAAATTIDYSKPAGYETKRYPLSGLVAGVDAQATIAHNDKYTDDTINFNLLNTNVKAWLSDAIYVHDSKRPQYTGVRQKYERCLDAPNYVVFSNTTSATQWNEDNFGTEGWEPDAAHNAAASRAIVSLEDPHNAIHLSVGGFDIPRVQVNESPIAGANGDMGENDTAAFDPIFFFHHCFVDRVFWLWQQRQGQTSQITIGDDMSQYPGTNSADGQGNSAGEPENAPLSLATALKPFKNPVGGSHGPSITGNDLIDIENQCNYTYGPGSLTGTPTAPSSSSQPPNGPAIPVVPIDGTTVPKTTNDPTTIAEARDHALSKSARPHPTHPTPTLRLTGLSRASTPGSFLITVWATINSDKHLVGIHPVLSRWHVHGCANCQTHLNVKAFVPLHGLEGMQGLDDMLEVRVHTRDDYDGVKKGKLVKRELGHMHGGGK